MRRNIKGRNNKDRNNFNTTIFMTGGVLIAAIATFIITFVVYSNKLNDDMYSYDSEYLAQYTNNDNKIIQNVETESVSSSIGKTVSEKEELLEKTNTNESSNRKSEATLVNTNTKNKTIKEEKNPIFQRPIEGEIQKEYAKESLVYSETLEEWTTHLGIDIKAERATVVKSAADGTVKYIKNDPRYGLTIIIEHSKGYETRYANLLTTEFVSEGEDVRAGQTIGTVGDSAIYEIVDESHLHFEILKDSESLNPAQYIDF